MKTQPWHSTKPSDPNVYHDNDSCAGGNDIATNKRMSGTDNRPKCEECDRLDRDETGNSDFEGNAGYGNTSDREITQKYEKNVSNAGDRFGDRKDRSDDPGNPNNPSPSHPSGPANPTDPAQRNQDDEDWQHGDWDRTKKESDEFHMGWE